MNEEPHKRAASTLAEELYRLRRVEVSACTGCGACSEVCPVVSGMDVPPADLIVQSKEDRPEVLAAASPWLCTDCRLCSRECPVGIDVARAVEGLRLIAYRRGSAPAQEPMVAFHQAFLEEVAQRGRLHEVSLLRRLRRRWPDRRPPWSRVAMLVGRGKLPLRAARLKGWPGGRALGLGGAVGGQEEGGRR